MEGMNVPPLDIGDKDAFAKLVEKHPILADLPHLIQRTFDVEEEYKELMALFHGVIDFLPIAIWVMESNGTIFLKNAKASAIDLDVTTIDHEIDDSEIKIGEKYYILQTARHNDKLILTATDNTKIRQQERLVSMGQMAAHLAHEIRNPIGSVSILASSLFDKVETRLKPRVLEIKKSIWRVERIVKATLLFSKGFTLSRREFYADELIDELQLAVSNYSYSKEITMRFDLPHVFINADFDLLSMVLQNLLFNAIDAIEETEQEVGNITFQYRFEGGHRIAVFDDGKPIPNPDQLFEAFKTTKTKGHGLGLTLSQQIAQAHGGQITFSASPKGFIVTIL